MFFAALRYGFITFAAIFFVGFITGMGGSFIPNLVFSLFMGVFGGVCYLGAHKLVAWLQARQAKKEREE